MASTRLLVLAVVRMAQPVHGYDVRRELLSWGMESWASVKPGSIYSALRTLEKDGLVAVTDRLRGEGRPERTEYVLTADGEKEYFALLREAWWTVSRAPEPFFPALALMPALTRAELLSATKARIARVEGELDELRFFRGTIQDGATGAEGLVPEHVRELVDLASARLRGELEWARGFLRRLRSGAYRFADETALTP